VKELKEVGYKYFGQLLFVGSDCNTISVLSANTGTALVAKESTTKQFHCLALSRDGTKVFSGSGDLCVGVWPVFHRMEKRLRALFGALEVHPGEWETRQVARDLAERLKRMKRALNQE
jgi:hypothetical protein